MNPMNVTALEFPLVWHGRLIVAAEFAEVDAESIHAIFNGFGLQADEVAMSQASSGGKYASWQLTCQIPDLVMFRAVTCALKSLPGFVMLL